MKPNHRSTIVVALLACLAACGPGTGGTGSGEDSPYFAVFGAQSAGVCTASISGALACPSSTVSGLPTPSDIPGTDMVNFADVAQGGNISVAIQANSIELKERCRSLRFLGDWGISGGNDARFFGSYMVGNMAAQPATLSVQTGGGSQSNELQVLVRDAAGRVLLGPVTLQRVPAAQAPTVACPP